MMDKTRLLLIGDAATDALLAMSDEDIAALALPDDADRVARIFAATEQAAREASAAEGPAWAPERAIIESLRKKRQEGRRLSPRRLTLVASASTASVGGLENRNPSSDGQPGPSRGKKSSPD